MNMLRPALQSQASIDPLPESATAKTASGQCSQGAESAGRHENGPPRAKRRGGPSVYKDAGSTSSRLQRQSLLLALRRVTPAPARAADTAATMPTAAPVWARSPLAAAVF